MAILDGRRVLVLVAHPDQPAEIPGFFSTGPSSIFSNLKEPPTVNGRPAGFGPNTGAVPRLDRGECWRAEASSEVLRFYRDGMLIFAMAADRDHLCWQTEEIINTLSLFESVYLFCVLYNQLIGSFHEPPNQIVVAFLIDHRGNERLYLSPYAIDSPAFRFPRNRRQAPEETKERSMATNGGDFLPEKVSYRLVQEIFAWFGIPTDSLPYSDREDERIDPSTFQTRF